MNPSSYSSHWATPSTPQERKEDAPSYCEFPYDNTGYGSGVYPSTLQEQNFQPYNLPEPHHPDGHMDVQGSPLSYANTQPMIPPSLRQPAAVSLMFGPSSLGEADLIFLTSDSVLFYLDEATISGASKNHFNGIFPLRYSLEDTQRVVSIDLHSTELQVILQVVYDVSYDGSVANPNYLNPSWQNPTKYSDLQAIIHGIDLLPQFGIDPKTRVHSLSKMYAYLLTCAPLYPLEVYAVAARHEIHELAISASSHLLSIDLTTINPQMAETIGALYYSKLNRLLEDRKLILSNLLSSEPGLHDPTKKCGFRDQQAFKKSWGQGISSLSWNMDPGVSTTRIKEVVFNATKNVGCRDCLKVRDDLLRTICAKWSLAPRTIQ